jgi:hypothetical protein
MSQHAGTGANTLRKKKSGARQLQSLLDQVALWQATGFLALAFLIWAVHVHDIVGYCFPDEPAEQKEWIGAWALTACVFSIGIIVVSHTYAQQKRVLKGFISVCSYCRRVNVESVGWEQMEEYISNRTLAEFTHGICPACFDKVIKEVDEAASGPPSTPGKGAGAA